MLKKEELAVRNVRQARAEAAFLAQGRGFFPDRLLIFLPIHAIGRIGQHVVKAPVLVGVLGQRVTEGDVFRVVTRHQHVGLADAKRLAVQLLAEKLDANIGIELLQGLLGEREHSARAARRVVNLPDDPLAPELLVVVDDDEVHDQPDHLARCEMLTGGFVGNFREAANQVFKQIAHRQRGDGFRAQVERGDLLEHLPQDAGIGESLQLVREEELVEKDIPNRVREGCDVGDEVLVNVAGILSSDFGECQRAGVVNTDATADGSIQHHVTGLFVYA